MSTAKGIVIALSAIAVLIELVYQIIYKLGIRKKLTSVGYKRMLHVFAVSISATAVLAFSDKLWLGLILAALLLAASILSGMSMDQVPSSWLEMGSATDNRKSISDGKTTWEKLKIALWY